MKMSALLCASAVAVAALALMAEGALAAPVKGSKSNNFRLDPTNPNAAADCIKAGGKVATDKDGNKVCSTPAPSAGEQAGIAVSDPGTPSDTKPAKPKSK